MFSPYTGQKMAPKHLIAKDLWKDVSETLVMMRRSVTFQEVRKWVQEHHRYELGACWIAHVKELCGLPVRRAPNRASDARAKSCPLDNQEAFKEAFRRFRMV